MCKLQTCLVNIIPLGLNLSRGTVVPLQQQRCQIRPIYTLLYNNGMHIHQKSKTFLNSKMNLSTVELTKLICFLSKYYYVIYSITSMMTSTKQNFKFSKKWHNVLRNYLNSEICQFLRPFPIHIIIVHLLLFFLKKTVSSMEIETLTCI